MTTFFVSTPACSHCGSLAKWQKHVAAPLNCLECSPPKTVTGEIDKRHFPATPPAHAGTHPPRTPRV